MKKLLTIILLAVVAGCGVEPENPIKVITPDGSTNVCEPRMGSYLVTYYERSGTCGPIQEVVITDLTVISPDCGGTVLVSVDNCKVTEEIACIIDNVYTAKGSGITNWSLDGSAGNGIMQMAISGPGYFCSSVYDVTCKRI